MPKYFSKIKWVELGEKCCDGRSNMAGYSFSQITRFKRLV